MPDNELHLSAEDRPGLEQLAAARQDIDASRAAALLAVAGGSSYAAAAEATGLTEGQVGYIVRRWRASGRAALPAAFATTDGPLEADADGVSAETRQLRALVDELNQLVAELQKAIPEQRAEEAAAYSPTRLLVLIRDNAQKLTPEMQISVLQNFQGMTVDDLTDIDTWKGMAYMMTYSARFQAGQVRDRVAGTINQVVPEPVQPGRLWQAGRSGLDRFTPEIVKQILSTFQGASREDLLDPDTWKGIWYMINYSLQFQAEQLKQRLTGETEPESES